MKTLALQKRIAASVLNVGQNKVWFNPEKLPDIKEAITKADITELVKEKIIKKKPTIGIKRRSGKAREKRKKKGRRRGEGKKRKIVKKRKTEYVHKIRKLRANINGIKQKGEIDSRVYNKLRRLAKAGIFRTKKDIQTWIEKLK